MSGIAAFSTKLMSGVRQAEQALIVCPTGEITGSGALTVKTTATGMTGSTITTSVAVLNHDTTAQVAEKIRVALRLVANIAAFFTVGGVGPYVTLTKITCAANIANMNLSVEKDTATGLTDNTTSTDLVTGQAYTEIANVTNIGGPALSVDTEDVTTHSSAGAFEEVVPTILRTGAMKLEINYDPANATHGATSGLLYKYMNKLYVSSQLRFPDSANTQFSFDGYVTGFEPGAPYAGKLSASASIKIDGVPTLNGTW